jgi:hypothetical protein
VLALNLAGKPVTNAAILRALRYGAGTRTMTFRFELLTSTLQLVRDISRQVEGASVENNALADIKRTATFRLVEDPARPIDYASQLIRPWARLEVGAPSPVIVEWPLGAFLLATPKKRLENGTTITRDVKAYDRLLEVEQRRSTGRESFPAGTPYTDALAQLIASPGSQRITPSGKVLPVTKTWDPGTSDLTKANALLGEIGYKSLTVDGFGVFVAEPYVSPADREPEYSYLADSASVLEGDPEIEVDFYDVPNEFVAVSSEPEREAMRAVYRNTDPASPTSTVARGRVITSDPIKVEAVDQATLDAAARRAAFEASQVYESIEFDTAIMPMHADGDVYTFGVEGFAAARAYSEQTWGFDLETGAAMSHRARRIVVV